MPISEVGHARNIASFEQMISIVTGFGMPYNPSNSNISVSKLNTKLAAANAANDAVQADFAGKTTAINIRENAFKPLGPTSTKAVNYYASTGTEKNKVEDVKTLNRKLQGTRKKAAVADDPATPVDESKQSISASQQSYTQKVEHLEGMIQLFSDDPLYNPNETAITIASLTTLAADLKQSTSDVINSITAFNNSRIERNTVMYHPTTGLYKLAMMVKQYVKSLYGASSPENKMVSKLKFRNEEM
jgi:hypothetical protein